MRRLRRVYNMFSRYLFFVFCQETTPVPFMPRCSCPQRICRSGVQHDYAAAAQESRQDDNPAACAACAVQCAGVRECGMI